MFTIYEDVFGSVPCFINQKRPDTYKNDVEKDTLLFQAKKLRNIGRNAYCGYQKLHIFTCNHADTMQSYVHVSKETIVFLPKVWRWSHPFFQAFNRKIITVKKYSILVFHKVMCLSKSNIFPASTLSGGSKNTVLQKYKQGCYWQKVIFAKTNKKCQALRLYFWTQNKQM